jgi:hypothetical protein
MTQTVAVPSPDDYVRALARTIIRLDHLHDALGEEGGNGELTESVLGDIALLMSLREGILNGMLRDRPKTLQ